VALRFDLFKAKKVYDPFERRYCWEGVDIPFHPVFCSKEAFSQVAV